MFKRAIGVLEKTIGPENSKTAILLNNLAMVCQAKDDYKQAQEIRERVLAINEKAFGTESINLFLPLNNLGLSYAFDGNYSRAEQLFNCALAISEKAFGTGHPEQVNALLNLATVYTERGDLTRGETYLQKTLVLAQEKLGARHPTVGGALLALGRLYIAKGDKEKALQYAKQAEEISEHNLALILATGSDEQKRLYMDSIRWETDGAVSLHLKIAAENLGAARFALTTILRRKGRVLDAMVNNMAALRKHLKPDDALLLDQLSSARTQLSTLTLRGPGGANVDEYKADLSRLEESVQKFESMVSERSAVFRAGSQIVSIEAVQNRIPEEAALVEMVSYKPLDLQAKPTDRFGTSRYAVYVLTSSGDPRWVDLGETSTIDAEIKNLRVALSDPKNADIARIGRAFDEKFMRPVRKLVGASKIILISPDGALNLVPFGALVDEQDHCLLEKYSFIYLTSGRDLLRFEGQEKSRQGPVVIADPLFDLNNNQAVQSLRPSTVQNQAAPGLFDFSNARFTPLPGTAEEARQLSTILTDANVLVKERATKGALRQLSGPSILHIATHGFFLADAPQAATQTMMSRQLVWEGIKSQPNASSIQNPLLRSGLAFAGANRRGGNTVDDNGIITAYETASLDLQGTKLVVLSACDTGVGEARVGQGVYGLRRALVMAGAESQVTSLWQVDDAATRDLMVDYYKRLQKGEGRGEALRDAQLSMLKSANRSHPYYWASFIQLGDWRGLDLEATKTPLQR